MPGEVREEVIAFINTSDTILEIASISVTPPLKAESIKSLILPGGEGSFRLILDLDRVAGEFEGQVRVQFKGNSQPPLVLDIVGHFVPLIEFQPYAAFFVGTHKGNSRTASIDILNHHNEPLYLEAPPSHSERYAINLEVIERGKHYRLSLTLDGNAPAGTQSDEIILRAKPPQEMLLKVQANTRIRERVYHYPDSVDMGALPWKVARDYESVRDLSQILMVYRHDTDDFEIEATIDVDYVKLISEPGPKGDRYQMTLTLIPEKIVPGKISREQDSDRFKDTTLYWSYFLYRLALKTNPILI
jgi:hypothetical protein